ncbi:putative uncharacterized protein C3orf56 [Fukomys damarensis]|uniref:putative uncharacterized protein C3orf56 n=1 Tax=Fukomys damarensis TaxID=885580 RepID=UPI00053F2D59|nr:putative uncharacterized protein C3orf56 [Fukomys damarensis]
MASSLHPADTTEPLQDPVWLRRPSGMKTGTGTAEGVAEASRGCLGCPDPWPGRDSVWGHCICQPVTDSTPCGGAMGPPRALHSHLGPTPHPYPNPWAHTWVPWGGGIWTWHPELSASAPVDWCRPSCSFNACTGGRQPTALQPSILPHYWGPPFSLTSTALGRDTNSCSPVRVQDPTSSAPWAAVGGPTRRAPNCRWHRSSPLGRASSLRSPGLLLSSSSQLCPLLLAPMIDPEPEPQPPILDPESQPPILDPEPQPPILDPEP